MGTEAAIDPRPGGEFRLNVDGEHIASGQIQEVDPPRRVVLTWGWEGSIDVPPGSTRVEITLEPRGNETLLLLRHTELPNQAEVASHNAGWTRYLAQLASKAHTSRH